MPRPPHSRVLAARLCAAPVLFSLALVGCSTAADVEPGDALPKPVTAREAAQSFVDAVADGDLTRACESAGDRARESAESMGLDCESYLRQHISDGALGPGTSLARVDDTETGAVVSVTRPSATTARTTTLTLTRTTSGWTVDL